jgi:endonuclease/exonuclease/phosphatase family metal-dependent hydrolase
MPHGISRVTAWPNAVLLGVLVAVTRVEASDQCSPRPPAYRSVTTNGLRPAQTTITIASLNMAGDIRIADTLAVWAQKRQVDVLLLQEVGHRSFDGEEFAAALGDRLGFYVAYAPADLLGETQTQGLAVLSRYPLAEIRSYSLKHHRLRFRSRCRIALAATVTTSDGPVHLVNVHLDTRINSKDRLAQLAPLLQALDDVDDPQIIGGDFNTMNIRWFRTMWPLPFLQRQAAAVRSRLGANGFDTPFGGGPPTFSFLGIPLRLDWLFLKRLTALEWSVDRLRFTDHRGVWARVGR